MVIASTCEGKCRKRTACEEVSEVEGAAVVRRGKNFAEGREICASRRKSRLQKLGVMRAVGAKDPLRRDPLRVWTVDVFITASVLVMVAGAGAARHIAMGGTRVARRFLREEEKFGLAHPSQRSSILHAPISTINRHGSSRAENGNAIKVFGRNNYGPVSGKSEKFRISGRIFTSLAALPERIIFQPLLQDGDSCFKRRLGRPFRAPLVV